MIWKCKRLMGKKYIQYRYFDDLRIAGLFFRFCQLLTDITFPFTRWLRYISVLTKVFYNIIIVYSIIHQWQNRTQCNGKNDKYGNKKSQWSVLCYKYTTQFVFLGDIMMNVIIILGDGVRVSRCGFENWWLFWVNWIIKWWTFLFSFYGKTS